MRISTQNNEEPKEIHIICNNPDNCRRAAPQTGLNFIPIQIKRLTGKQRKISNTRFRIKTEFY
jgi:hypothetical protein